MKSIIQKERECWVCGNTIGLHSHHIFYGSGRRNISEREGLKVWLCARHHNASDEGVHYNGDLDRRLKILGETVWCEKNEATPDDFIKLMGRNYL